MFKHFLSYLSEIDLCNSSSLILYIIFLINLVMTFLNLKNWKFCIKQWIIYIIGKHKTYMRYIYCIEIYIQFPLFFMYIFFLSSYEWTPLHWHSHLPILIGLEYNFLLLLFIICTVRRKESFYLKAIFISQLSLQGILFQSSIFSRHNLCINLNINS